MNRLFFIGFASAFALFIVWVIMATRLAWVAAYYPWIFWVNVLVITALGLATLHRLINLLRYVRRQENGSRLARRLFTTLALVSVIPSLVVYGLSYRFLDTSVESWFQLEIDNTVNKGLDLARWVQTEESKRLEQAANGLAQTLSEMSAAERRIEINRWRDILGAEEVSLFDENRQFFGVSKQERYDLAQELPSNINVADIGFRATARIESNLEDITAAPTDINLNKPPLIRVLVRLPVNVMTTANQQSSLWSSAFLPPSSRLYLQIVKTMPDSIHASTRDLAAAYQQYGELQQGRKGLKKLFLTALTMLFVLTLICALWLAQYYSQRFVRPLAVLVEATRAAARGDFSHRLVEGDTHHDEFDQLIVSFNDMLADLKGAQESASVAQKEMKEARAFLENVLNHLNAGVLIIEPPVNTVGEQSAPSTTAQWILLSVNSAAHKLLAENLSEFLGRSLHEAEHQSLALRTLLPFVREHLDKALRHITALDNPDEAMPEWTHNVELRMEQGYRTMVVRGTRLPQSSRWVVVFDDITELLRAQHMTIWSELARRLAHEIKNPLTPIQLSAERLQMKVSDKLPEAERDILDRSIGTIINQVDAIKTLVNQFREMSRPASTHLEVFRVNDLLQEVAALYDDKRINVSVPRKKYKVLADRHQLRQVFHNLILNAEQANQEKWGSWEHSRVRLSLMEGIAETPPLGPISTSSKVLGQTRVNRMEGDTVSDPSAGANNTATINAKTPVMGVWMVVADIGGGFAPEMMGRAFEPNVTSKIKGSGLGLSIVRKIVEEHHGIIRVHNDIWQAGDPDHQWDTISKKLLTKAAKIQADNQSDNGAEAQEKNEPTMEVRGAVVMVWLPQVE